MQETCWFCQKPLDYDKWIEGNPDEAFGIAYTQPFVKTWMPFYISKRSTTPTFDEDFTLYGYDRLIQVNSVTTWPDSNECRRPLNRRWKCDIITLSHHFPLMSQSRLAQDKNRPVPLHGGTSCETNWSSKFFLQVYFRFVRWRNADFHFKFWIWDFW